MRSRAHIPLIDVRTPAEFEKGHIPGAVNIPLFTNDERADVGTIYKQVSADKAYEVAYNYVRPKLDWYIAESGKVAPEGEAVVYCWRGGMRSKSFAEHLIENGFSGVHVIEDGYKGFRKHALGSFGTEGQLVVLGGFTGSGKSRLLHHLSGMGEQVIDLEKLASHRGSAFGGIGQPDQPTTEHFANLLFWKWKDLDLRRRIWVEDESINIGRVNIPESFFTRMRSSQVCFLEIPREERAKFLVKEYASLDKEALARAIGRISKRLGGLRTREALEALQQGDFETTAMITLEYYDKTYLKGLGNRDSKLVKVIGSDRVDAAHNSELILSWLD